MAKDCIFLLALRSRLRLDLVDFADARDEEGDSKDVDTVVTVDAGEGMLFLAFLVLFDLDRFEEGDAPSGEEDGVRLLGELIFASLSEAFAVFRRDSVFTTIVLVEAEWEEDERRLSLPFDDERRRPEDEDERLRADGEDWPPNDTRPAEMLRATRPDEELREDTDASRTTLDGEDPPRLREPDVEESLGFQLDDSRVKDDFFFFLIFDSEDDLGMVIM